MEISRWLRSMVAALVLLVAALGLPAIGKEKTCTGRFINPITETCWSCIMPLSIGAIPVAVFGQEDIENPSSPICICPGWPPKIGLSLGFWVPQYVAETTNAPGCLISLGGIDVDLGWSTPRGAQESRPATSSGTRGVFMQAHWFLNPLLSWLEIFDYFPCLDPGGYDLAYMTELDPSWNEDDLALILAPESILFTNIIAIAACGADCIAATTGFPIQAMSWCGGCAGHLFPLTGNVPARLGGVQASSLLMQRLTLKMHRQFLAYRTHGKSALCGARPDPVMDRRAYKSQLLYPISSTTKYDGRCCQPFGRSTVLYESGKEYPIKGEIGWSFLLFKKKNCCLTY
jgi:conjugal transfer pilus assembly protein TraU